MSALALLVDRRQAPVPGDFDAVFRALDEHGHDGRRVVRRPWAILGHHHFWTVPEEVGEQQPVEDPESGSLLAFDGRVDNRSQLIDELELEHSAARQLSDAELVLKAWTAWGEECFAHLLGPFAVAILEEQRRRVVCARDPLGDRSLSYHARGGNLVIATEAAALPHHPRISPQLDEASLARYFAVEAPAEGATFFTDVCELPPAHLMVADDDGVRLRRYATEPEGSSHRTDQEWVEIFRERLRDSVRCRMRTVGPPLVLMSGGLDSTTVAALAARELSEADPSARLRTVSWVFDELEEADEREYIEAMIEHFDLEGTLIASDDGWPNPENRDGGSNPNLPARDVYHRLMERAHAEVHMSQARTLLSGHFGDQLYGAWPYWLRDLLTSGRPFEALRRFKSELNGHPIRSLVKPGVLRTTMAATLGRHGRRQLPPWLTPHAQALVASRSGRAPDSASRPDRRVLRTPSDPLWAHAASLNAAAAARRGIDPRCPYRDRRVVELLQSMPGHLLHRPGWSKWVLREATRRLLPDPVRQRTRRSTMAPLVSRGFAEREYRTLGKVLNSNDAAWRPYVRADWLEARTPSALSAGGVAAVVAWNCLCLEKWTRNNPKSRLEPVDMLKPDHVRSDHAGERSL